MWTGLFVDEVEYVGAGGAKYRTDCAAWNGAGYCSKDHEHYAYGVQDYTAQLPSNYTAKLSSKEVGLQV